jgi:hypothetical protein
MAHGSPGEPALTWDRYQDALRSDGPPEAPRLAGQLATDGLLRRVPIEGPEAAAFAARHRLVALMTGVGVHADTPPEMVSLGVFGKPITHVDELAYDLWFWARARPSLAEAAQRHGGVTPVLSALHQLLSASAAYLDPLEA